MYCTKFILKCNQLKTVSTIFLFCMINPNHYPMKLTSIQAFLLLQFLPGIGDITVKKLVDHCGDAQAVF